jgi:hypothetical protein
MSEDYFEPDCPHKDDCSSKGHLCGSCKHNKKNKKNDHYEPIHPQPPRPYDPYPYYSRPWFIDMR